MRPLSPALAALLLACCGDSPPAGLGGHAFWDDLDLSGAIDMGYQVEELPAPERVPPGPITLTDVTEGAGLATAVSGGNTHGVGVSFADLNGDDLPDIFVANGMSNNTGAVYQSAVYVNRGDGTFDDVSGPSGIASILEDVDTYSAAAGDYDGDGDVDLYVGAQPHDVLLRNCSAGGDPCFEDATSAANAGGPLSDPSLVGNGKSKIAAFGDFDSDGDLDIASASSTLPEPYAYLLRNNGDGTFTDVSAETGVRANPAGNPCAVMWSDYDNDGDPDLWIWNDRGGHILLRNEAGVSFEDVTVESRLINVEINNPMGIDAADFDHDGDLDYYVSNIGDNPLLRNNGDGTFSDITQEAGTGGDFGWGVSFQDFDGDTYPDIFVAQEDNLPYIVFHNISGDGPRFERIDVPHIPVQNASAAHNVAVGFADYDRDGRIDVLAATTDGSRISLFRNETDLGSHNWLNVVVRAPDGPESADGISARVGVKTGELLQFRDITGGSSRASQNELSVRFGLGNYTGADWVAVLWPTGRQILVENVEGGQTLVLPLSP